MGLGKPAAARNTDSFAGEMQAKVGAWCSQCRNQRPKNCTEAMKGEKRSTPTAADEEQRSSGRKAARRERFTPGSSGSDLGGESHNLRDKSDPWRIHSVRSMEDLSGMPIAVPVAVSMAAPPGSPRRQVAAPSEGASGSLSPRAMSDVRGAFCAPPHGGGGGGGGGGRRQSNRNISPLDAATRDNAALQAQVAEMESKQRTDAKALEQAAREVEGSRGVVQENAALKAQLADLQQVDSAESPFKALVRAVLTPEEVATLQASCVGFDALAVGTRTKKWDDPKSTGVLNYLHVAKQVLAKVGGLLSAGRCDADQMWQLLCTRHEFSFLQLTGADHLAGGGALDDVLTAPLLQALKNAQSMHQQDHGVKYKRLFRQLLSLVCAPPSPGCGAGEGDRRLSIRKLQEALGEKGLHVTTHQVSEARKHAGQTFAGNFVQQLKITRNRISKEQAEHMFSYRVRHDVASISMSNMWGSGVAHRAQERGSVRIKQKKSQQKTIKANED